ncbi:MAG: D-alanyl-D-alanine carboxypeptidase, partial [Alphaproteobacteria bacterium]|nr:D-alanyl-D-alanine carboxypeptidase [Alphaproteobacteria bacterium]
MHRIVPKLALVLCLLLGTPVAQAQSLDSYSAAKQAILLDYETGTVLFEKNADQRMPTSSMSKVMTMYMVFEALKEGRITLDTELPVSEKAWRKQGSKMFVEVGDHVRVEDLIRGVLVQSGNDATIVFAEGLAGSEKAFAEAMTARAKSLGMTNSNFTNASGWPDDDHYSSARDLAILARSVIMNFPEYFPYFSIPEFTYNAIKQRNRNPLLYRNIGADGMKTGYTVAGGYGLIGTGERNGRRVVLVINGAENDKVRAQEGARLLEWGLTGFRNVNVFASGETVLKAPVVMGGSKTVPLTVDSDVRITIPVTKTDEIRMEAVYNGPLVAPVERGREVGTFRISIPGMKPVETPLVAAQDVSRLG